MISVSINQLKLFSESRGIKDYDNKIEDELIKIFSKPKPKINFSKKRTEKIREKFNESRNRFSKSKIKEIRRNLYKIKKQKNLSTPEIKEIEKNLLELENNLFKPRKYYNYDDIKYKGIKDVRNLYDLSIEDFYKPIRTNTAFNSNFIEYESIGEKLKIQEYLDMIKPYLKDLINNHKTQGKWKINSKNAIIDYKNQGEWKNEWSLW